MEPDLSGFPIIRVDQIPIIDTNILRDVDVESAILLSSLMRELDPYNSDTKPPMISYLQRQIKNVKEELARRLASSRIDDMLRSAKEVLDSGSTTVTGETDSALFVKNPHLQSQIHINTETPRQEITTRQPLSAPSKPGSIMASVGSHDIAPGGYEAPSMALQSSSFRPLPLPSELRTSSKSNTEKPSTIDTDEDLEESSFKNRQDTSMSQKPRRPRSSGGYEASKRGLNVINESFGNTFVVGAIEKKKRFYPKKQPVETPEEQKERERNER